MVKCTPHNVAGRRPATLLVLYTTSYNTQSSAPEDGRDQHPKHVEMIGIINIPLLMHLVGVYIIYINHTRSNKRQLLLQFLGAWQHMTLHALPLKYVR